MRLWTEKCQMCHAEVDGVIFARVIGFNAVQLCERCYGEVDAHRHQPYSKVMDSYSMLTSGYHLSQKQARMRKEARR